MDDKNAHVMKMAIKLAALMNVLKVAIAKIEVQKENSDNDMEQLDDIITKLRSTLKMCERSMEVLETQMMSPGGSGILDAPIQHSESGAREYVEMSSAEEYRKFMEMDPIQPSEIEGVDWRELLKQLGKV